MEVDCQYQIIIIMLIGVKIASYTEVKVQSRPQTLKQFVKVSSPFPFSMLFLTPKCFTFVNIEWGSGVFQGIVAAVVSSGGNFFAHV